MSLWAEPSVFGAEKKEQDRIQQELYRLSNAVQQLSRSQEGMRSLFDSQANKLQSLYAKNQSSPFVVQSELQAELKELNATLISHFRAYDESLERLKTGLESLGGLIQKQTKGINNSLNPLICVLMNCNNRLKHSKKHRQQHEIQRLRPI